MAWEQGTAANHSDLLARLRRFITGSATNSTPVVTGAGNGSVDIETKPAAVTENWTLTCVTAAANGGVFSVSSSVSGAKPNLTVGVLYTTAQLSMMVSDGSVDFTVGQTITFTTTIGALTVAGQAWEQLRYSNGDLMVKGKGLGGLDEIYVNIDTFINTNDGVYNWVLRGAVSYNGANDVQDQAGQAPPVGLSLWNNAMRYWFFANGRRFIVVAQVSASYVSAYAGLILPYATPTQYPYPLFVGGNLPTGSGSDAPYQTENYSWADARNTNFWRPLQTSPSGYNLTDRTQCHLYWNDGSWIDFSNGYTNSFTNGQFTPYTGVQTTANLIHPVHRNWVRECLDGSYQLLPYTLTTATPSSAVVGELDGCYSVSGFNNGSENTVTVGGDTYLVVQNVGRNSVGDYIAIKMV